MTPAAVRLLVDANLSPRLVALLVDVFPNPPTWRKSGAGQRRFARPGSTRATTASLSSRKDSDCRSHEPCLASPPKVVWLRREHIARPTADRALLRGRCALRWVDFEPKPRGCRLADARRSSLRHHARHTDQRRRHRCPHARRGGSHDRLHAVGQPHHDAVRRGARHARQAHPRAPRGGRRAHGGRLGPAHGTMRRRARQRRRRLHQCGGRALHGAGGRVADGAAGGACRR